MGKFLRSSIAGAVLLALVYVARFWWRAAWWRAAAAPPSGDACSKPQVWRGVLSAEQLRPYAPARLASELGNRPVVVTRYSRRSNPVKLGERGSTLPGFAAACASARRLKGSVHEQVLLTPVDIPLLDEVPTLLRPYLSFEGFEPEAKTLLRVSRVPWEYGNHYDCTDGYLLQLHNRRRIKLTCQPVAPYSNFGVPPKELPATTYEYVLSPGDLLRIPSTLSHAVDTYEAGALDGSGVSIAATVSLQRLDHDVCDAKFDRTFPGRTHFLLKGDN
jgi:hypothetical protein